MGCKRSGYAFLRVGATMRQRARATLPARRRTSHGSLSAALQLLLVQQQLWEPRTGRETGHRGRVRVTNNTRLVGAYDRSDGLSSDRSRSAAARRDSRWRRRGIGRLDAAISPVACGRVSSRIMICVF